MINYGLQEDLTPNLLFVDGLTRCGKSVFSPLMGTFQDTEQLRFFNLFEQVTAGLKLGSVDHRFAEALLRIQLNELSYDIKLSRNANFRKGDQTSIYSHPNSHLYELRLEKSDGDEIVSEIRSDSQVMPIMLHDAMLSIDSLLALRIRFKMIELYRHPVDLIISQNMRQWGSRFGNDPRAFTMTVTRNGFFYPWYALGFEELWDDLTDLERTVWITSNLLTRSVANHRSLSDANNFLTIFFEDFVTDPLPDIRRIAAFIGKSPTRFTWATLTQLNIPRILDLSLRREKLEFLQNNVRDSLMAPLRDLIQEYEMNHFDLPHIR